MTDAEMIAECAASIDALASHLERLDSGSGEARALRMCAQYLVQTQAERDDARAEADRLRGALERIAGFAPGYGEIAEKIAQMARHALDPELAAMHEAWRAALQEQRDD